MKKETLNNKKKEPEVVKNEDSYISTSDNLTTKPAPKKKIDYFGYISKNDEIANNYRRMNDIHHLELKYFKNDVNPVSSRNFSEVYYNFKKK